MFITGSNVYEYVRVLALYTFDGPPRWSNSFSMFQRQRRQWKMQVLYVSQCNIEVCTVSGKLLDRKFLVSLFFFYPPPQRSATFSFQLLSSWPGLPQRLSLTILCIQPRPTNRQTRCVYLYIVYAYTHTHTHPYWYYSYRPVLLLHISFHDINKFTKLGQ